MSLGHIRPYIRLVRPVSRRTRSAAQRRAGRWRTALVVRHPNVLRMRRAAAHGEQRATAGQAAISAGPSSPGRTRRTRTGPSLSSSGRRVRRGRNTSQTDDAQTARGDTRIRRSAAAAGNETASAASLQEQRFSAGRPFIGDGVRPLRQWQWSSHYIHFAAETTPDSQAPPGGLGSGSHQGDRPPVKPAAQAPDELGLAARRLRLGYETDQPDPGYLLFANSAQWPVGAAFGDDQSWRTVRSRQRQSGAKAVTGTVQHDDRIDPGGHPP
jgi:hypothetical protein